MHNTNDVTIAPVIKSFNKKFAGIDAIKPTAIYLNNNIPLYKINIGNQEVVKLEFIFDAGSCYQDKALVASFTNQLITEGTKNYNAEKISEVLDYYGAFIEKEVDRDYASIIVYALRKHITNILPVIEEIIKEPVFPENELSILLNKQRSQFIINNKKVMFIARSKFTEIIYGEDHPYGRTSKLEDFDQITKVDIIEFHNRFYHSSNCKIIIAGNIDDELIENINSTFGTERWGKNNATYTSNIDYNNNTSLPKKTVIEKENSVQSAIRIGKVIFNMDNEDYIKLQVLNTVLGGYFGSRLMKNIREDKGYTYGIGSAIIPLKNSGYFFISTETGSEVTFQAVEEIYKELKKLREEPVSEEELELVKNYKTGEIMRSLDGALAISDLTKLSIQFNLDADYFEKYLSIVRNITPEELQELAIKYLNENNMFELVVGKGTN